MSSREPAEPETIDLQRDVPTTGEDVEVLRRLRERTPSWFSLSPADLEALVPAAALRRRPATRPGARPFVLP
jgi:hypothetical protein